MLIAFYKGKKRPFNRFVSWWTVGPYSHVEAVFDKQSGGLHYCASSSFMDKGVRFTWIDLDPNKWDIIDVPCVGGLRVMQWFMDHKGDPYDLLGLLATSCPIRHSKRRWFCNEAIGTAGGLKESWRYNPNSFARLLEMLPGSRWIQGGPSDES